MNSVNNVVRQKRKANESVRNISKLDGVNMLKYIGFLVTTIILLTGCNLSDTSSTSSTPTPLEEFQVSATESLATEAPALPAPVSNDDCGNPYYPVVNGAEWVYTGPQGSFSHSLATGTEGAFTIKVEADANTFLIQGLCLEGGDINLLDVPGNSLNYSGEEGSSTMTTTGNEGVTLPGDIQEGDDWSQTISVEVSAGEQKMSFTIDTTYTAVGYETITVPAGTFNALKIEQSSDMGGSQPTIQTLWYVQNIGMVKSVIDAGEPIVSELVSYSIP
jgi:hypothetical protein